MSSWLDGEAVTMSSNCFQRRILTPILRKSERIVCPLAHAIGSHEATSRREQKGACNEATIKFFSAAAGNVEADESLKVVQFLNSLRNYEKRGVPQGAGTESDAGFDLQRMHRLLQHLDDPLSKYPVVHVAGTKGKGSTVAFLSSILRAAGFRVGSYTSPHIRSLRERIVSGGTGQPISVQAFNQLYDDLHEKINDAVISEFGLLTHFEVLTGLAFAHFAKEKVDMAVIEAGLGGARDATNVIQAQGLLAAVIVGIGEEHLDALGGSLLNIALAKAGIIKEGRPVILGRQTYTLAENTLRQVAASKNAVVLPPPGCNTAYGLKGIITDNISPHQICDISIDNTFANGNAEVWMIKDLKIPTLGAHQRDNTTTAIHTALCLQRQGWKISDSAIRLGVESTVIPGRFQFITRAEAKELGSQGSAVILDGAHTEGSAAALAHTLRECLPNECLAIVVAMASDKDHLGFARAILEGTKLKIIVTTKVVIAGSYARSTPTSTLANSFVQAGLDLNMELLCEHQIHPSDRLVSKAGLSSNEPGPTVGKVELNDMGVSQGTRLHKRQAAVVEADSLQQGIKNAAHLIHEMNEGKPGVICITGSLHIVSATFSLLSTKQ